MTRPTRQLGRPGPTPLTVRLLRRSVIDPDTGCWVWQGNRNAKGYGFLTVAGINLRVHRISYEVHVGPIPDGLFIDHLCNNPSCVNPEHMEPVTAAENNRRAAARRRASTPVMHGAKDGQSRTCAHGAVIPPRIHQP